MRSPLPRLPPASSSELPFPANPALPDDPGRDAGQAVDEDGSDGIPRQPEPDDEAPTQPSLFPRPGRSEVPARPSLAPRFRIDR